jgi:hypothetical protein
MILVPLSRAFRNGRNRYRDYRARGIQRRTASADAQKMLDF